MSAQPIITVDRTGTVSPSASAQPCSSGGDSFPNTGAQVVAWENLGSSPVTVSEVIQATVDGQTPPPRTFTVPGAIAAAPAAPTLATAATGGTIAAGTYQVEITYTNAAGETLASVSSSIITTGTTSTITIDSPVPATNATGWYAYVTQVGGASYTRQQTTPTAIGTNLVLTAPPTATGSAPPQAATVGTLMSGPYPTTIYNDTSSNMNFTYSVNPPTGLKMTALQNSSN